MSSLVRYWVVKRPSKVKPGTMKPVSHFKSEEEADTFLNSEFFKKTFGEGVVEVVSFDIYETAEEAEADSTQRLRESGLAKLRTLTRKEAIALNIEHILNETPVTPVVNSDDSSLDLIPPSA